MKIGHLIVFTSTVAALQLTQLQAAEDQPAFKDDKEKASYGIGVFFGNQIKRGNIDVNVDTIVAAMKDVLDGKETKLTQQQAQQAIMAYTQKHNRELAEKNEKAGEAFLAENKKKQGILTKTVTLNETNSAEFQYKIISEGSGDSPKPTDSVKVNYRGTLIDGTEFDSSAKHGSQPSQFMVNRVVRGWSEALQMMKPGAKWQLFIPASLAYGDNPRPGIEPGSTLIFDVELVEINQPAAPQAQANPAKPLTSDIIRVPSADEMKAGAKIQVIKASDLEKSNSVQNATSGSTNKN